MTDQPPAAELASLCKSIAARGVLWTQGAGGNVSIKDSGALWIKASGMRLDSVREERGIVALDQAALVAALKDASSEEQYAEAIQECPRKNRSDMRASMESGMHAALPKKYVVHFHSLTGVLLAELARRQSELAGKTIAKCIPDFSIAFLPFEMPGFELMKRVNAFADYDVLILENHGVLIQTEELSVIDGWDAAERAIQREMNWDFGALDANLSLLEMPEKLYFPDSAVLRERLRAVKGNPQTHDRDAAELWRAQYLLYKIEPELREIPIPAAQTIAELPTEKARVRTWAQNQFNL